MRTRWHCTSEWDSRRSGDSRRSCGKDFRVCLEIIWGVGSGNEGDFDAEARREKSPSFARIGRLKSAPPKNAPTNGGMAAWKATLLQDGEHVGEVVCPDSEGAFLAEEFGQTTSPTCSPS